jgi:transcription elongation factor Elf1
MLTGKAARHTATGKPFFKCPNCSALYHIVKVEAGPETVHGEITCRACGAPLQARQGKFVIKYFLLRNAGRSQGQKRA